jgi:hypothetical protein
MSERQRKLRVNEEASRMADEVLVALDTVNRASAF